MKHLRPFAVATLVTLMLVGPAWSAVFVTVGKPKLSTIADGQQVEQELKLASEVANYTLKWDYNRLDDKPDEITSKWWGWTTGYVPLGMDEPSRANWYYQAFFNWYFDEESIYNRPPEMRVVRAGGDDGMIEIKWETPNATASIRFAMTTGSDKLLVFGHYEPKGPIGRSYVRLSCYPSFFPEPRQRAVTTALGTRPPGETINLDLERERWVLYEDTSEGREGSGSAGLLVGTPDAFSGITIPVGAYGIVTTLELAPDKRDFAVALYDFPSMPDYRQAREYFARSADQEAEALEKAATGDLDQPLPVLPYDEERLARILEEGERMFDRPAELWRPNPEPLSFPWAKNIPGEPIETVLFAPRWYAWETMELGRRLPLDVQHLYFDGRDVLSSTRAWPYRNETGIGPIPYGVAARKAASLAADESVELFVCASVDGRALPGVARSGIAKQVASGKALILSGPGWVRSDWDQALFEDEAPEIADAILAGLDWEKIPGLGEEEPGRVGGDPPVRVFRYGEGLVIWLSISTNHYGALTPRNDATEGIMSAMDRSLGIAARAALAGVGRDPLCELILLPDQVADRRLPVSIEPAPPAASTLQVRIQDDLERVIAERELKLPLAGDAIALPPVPPSRQWYVDALLKDGNGRCLGFGFAALPPGEGPAVGDIAISPSKLTGASVPWVQQQGGDVTFETTVIDAPEGARLVWEVRDVFDRLLATTETAAPANGQAARVALTLSRPVTVCHIVDVTLKSGDEVLDFERQRFTMQVPYPYDDFTGLMWTTCGGMPVIRMTDRYCYEWGAEMCDPANTLRRSDESAARDYALTSRSGLRMVPYVTRISGEGDQDGHRVPCLHDPAYIASQEEYLTINGRQGAPYQPAAYTLGDENYLTRRPKEVCYRPESIAAFKEWLKNKYGDIGALNAEWGTDYGSLEAIDTPPKLAEAAESGRFVPWMDHKAFMDEAFIEAHEMCAEWLRAQDPGAKVGWDGILSYHFCSGYEFTRYTENLELNQTYLRQRLQGEAVRSFKRPDALTGKWGNRVADNEAGWHAFPWHCLMLGDNSVWWWTSWGCDYTPFNPDLSQNNFGKWFFEALREATAGPGKLLLHGERQDRQVAMLYSKRDMFAAALAGELVEDAPFASENSFMRQQEAIFLGITDMGVEFSFISHADLEAERLDPQETPLLVLSLASSLSDAQVEAIRAYVEAGGTLLVDGRVGLMNENGHLRESRPLDDLLGVSSPAGMEAFKQPQATGAVAVQGSLSGVKQARDLDLAEFDVAVLEPTLQVGGGTALAEVDGAPILIAHRVGKGMAIMLNLSMHELTSSRQAEDPKPRREIIAAVLAGAGLRAPCELKRSDGTWPLCVRQAVFQDGSARYLMLQQDIILPALPEQQAHLTLPEPSIVYDLRAGKRIGTGKVREWDVTLSRERPLIFSLMPYEVTGVSVQAGTATRGENTPVQVAVSVAGGAPGYHVVRLNVYPPGSRTPHRQYSQNLGCDGGKGSGSIPFALSDPTGQWRLEVRDVASGVTAEGHITVK